MTIQAEERAQLPGMREAAVVRRFEAPEALDTRFYEVRARSALNRVPEASRMPFRWTVNPYRGCTHACVYCLEPDTPVLLADGRQMGIGGLDVGDRIIGTVRDGTCRRLAETTVEARWSSRKEAYRVVLADGTELVASADHRFLTGRGWKHVTGADHGRDRRPHLTLDDDLVGFGASPDRRDDSGCKGFVAGISDAIGGQRSLGRLKTPADLRVVAIEPVGKRIPLVDITTGTGDFIANGVVSHNCFARPTHAYLGFGAGRDFEREIVVKVNVPEVLAGELRRPSWGGEHVAMGTNTDPYQWVEGRYELMRGIWTALRDARNPSSVLTKSPLVLRDLDLLREINEVADVTASLSIPTLDEKAWRASEPRTLHPRARFEAVAELRRAGIASGVLVAPLMPGINDDPRQVEAILEAASEAGATSIGGIGLHLRGETRGVFLDWLRSARPDLVDHYEELYAGGAAYLPPAEQRRLQALVHGPGAPPPSDFDRRASSAGARRAERRPPGSAPRSSVHAQEVLF